MGWFAYPQGRNPLLGMQGLARAASLTPALVRFTAQARREREQRRRRRRRGLRCGYCAEVWAGGCADAPVGGVIRAVA